MSCGVGLFCDGRKDNRDMSSELYKIFPIKLRDLFEGTEPERDGFTELRFRCNGPVTLLKGREEFFLHSQGGLTQKTDSAYCCSVNEIREMMEYISNFSVYAYEEELKQGFITIPGGHRVGLCGKVVLSEGRIKTIRNISFLNIRLAKERKGCADVLIPYLYDGDRLCHTLIVSAPGCGKTTLLRDLIRQVSNGSTKHRGRKVGVVDERSELAACYYGVPQNDLGMRTDVLDGCPKENGMELLLRAMSPEVIAVDELGGEREVAMAVRAIGNGCSLLATMHGDGQNAWFHAGERQRRNPDVFERYVFLKSACEPGKIEAICNADGEELFSV